MIKKEVSANARRARNILWNAAGRYDFEPPFLAFFPNGVPDHYFNMIAGLAVKWLDLGRLWDFFASYADDRRAGEFDDLLWLGLENCLYEKELVERPMMERLRKQRAERFYLEQQSLSRQQMEYQSMLVYTQQEARWAGVSGRRLPLLSPREKQMSEALRFPGSLDTEGVLAAMRSFLQRFFRLNPGKSAAAPRRSTALERLLLRREHRRRDRLFVRVGTGEGDHARAVQQRHEGLGRYEGPGEEDEAFVQAAFGQSLLSEPERRALENELCDGVDADCRLYVSRGEGGTGGTKEALELREAAAKQRRRNEAFRSEHSAAIQGSVRALSTRIDTVLSSYLKHLPEPARAGRIRPEAAWRLPLLQDGQVFLKNGEETEPEICVDLLLDASQSRMNSQELIAAQAYIIARSLEKLHIPVRVSSFRSLRGYTVLELLKSWRDRGCEGVLRYYAGGWNRDALALELLGRLGSDSAILGKERLLLILTDAAPNDSAPLAGTGLKLSREYEGAVAVKAAQDAVRALRDGGLRVGAVFLGSGSHLEDLHQIYGHAAVRIRKVSQLAQGVSDLLLMLLREARKD